MLVTVLPPIVSNYLKSFDFDFFFNFSHDTASSFEACYYVILLLMSVTVYLFIL